MTSTRDQLFLDLFTTALEGGIGYWSECTAYHWENPATGDEDVRGFYATVVDVEDDNVEHRIDRSVIAGGYTLAIGPNQRNRLRWSVDPPPFVITNDTDWDFDAGDADMVVQLGLFGEVVYG